MTVQFWIDFVAPVTIAVLFLFVIYAAYNFYKVGRS